MQELTCRAHALGKGSQTARVAASILWGCLLAGFGLSSSEAQVTPVTTSITPTIGAGNLGTTVTAPPAGGTTTTITHGTRPLTSSGTPGPNLFHSFDQFSIAANNTANFLNETGFATTNIVSRVTGGQVSNIYGTIQTTNFGAANFYLLSPAGVIFGPTASLNVGGSFHISTGDYVKFANGDTFFADPANQGSVLSVAPVTDFGFLGPAPASITLQGSSLAVPDSNTISVVGGGLTLQSEFLEDGGIIPTTTLSAPNGRVQLVSVGSSGEVRIANSDGSPTLKLEGVTSLGTINFLGSPVLESPTLLIRGLLAGSVTDGHIVYDGSLGPAGPLVGPAFLIPAEDGEISGSNLFHSFSRFDLYGGESATFQAPVDPNIAITISNILARVTGGQQSFIDGTIKTDIPGAHLYLMNPSGLVFGLGAFLDTSGSLHITTANQVRFADNAIFSAGPFPAPLDAGQPEAFGFTASRPSSIDIFGDPFLGLLGSSVKSFSVVGGDIMISSANISAPSGTIQITAVDQLTNPAVPGEVGVAPSGDPPAVGVTGFSRLGQINAIQGAAINVNPVSDETGEFVSGAGNILVRGRSLLVDSSSILAETQGSFAGAPVGVNIHVDEGLTLSNGTTVQTSTQNGGGQAGKVIVQAGTLTVDTGSAISGFTNAGGQAGNLEVTASKVIVSGGGLIDSSNRGGNGSAGDVVIEASTSVSVTGSNPATEQASAIKSVTQGEGPAGAIRITSPLIHISEGGEVSAATEGAGPGGSILLQGTRTAPDTGILSVSRARIETESSAHLADPSKAAGGNIEIHSGTIQITNAGLISAKSTGSGIAGNISLSGGSLGVMSGGRVEASTSAQGTGGTINITTTGDVTISGVSADGQTRSGIFAKTQTSESGSGGGSGSGSSGSGSGGGGGVPSTTAGDAGDINIRGKNLLVDRGAQIDSSTTSGGAGGDVSLTAAEGSITIVGTGTRLTSDASRGDGTGGKLVLQAQNITVSDKASVTAATGGKGDAGSIAMTAQDTLLLESGGTITTSTRGAGKGGTILITADQLILDGPGSSIIADTLRPFADLGVTLEILHTNDGDLVAQLDSPAGTRVALFSRVGGNGDNFTGTTLNDRAATQITANAAPFAGTFQPREPLGQLIDQPATGVWTLNIRDGATENTGQLKNWSIRIGEQVFQSANVPATIPDNGALQSAATVTGPAGATIQGIGEISGIGGDVTIQAGTVTIQNGATMSATSRGSGKGGTLHVNATGPIILTGANSGLFTDAEGSGPGGSINVQAARVDLASGATISAASSGSAATATGGVIDIVAGQVQLTNGGIITAKSFGPANAGSVHITVDDSFESQGSSITTEALKADGGDIIINARRLVHLTNSDVTSTVGSVDVKTTTGGNIFIDPEFVILDNSRILANAFAGTGGNINIVTGVLLVDPLSIIDASSALGVSGTVTIQSPISNLSETLAPLPQAFLRTGALLSSRCVARLGGPASSFVVAGRDAIPMEPGGLLPSPLHSFDNSASANSHDKQTTSNVRLGAEGLIALNLVGLDGAADCAP